MYLRALLHLSYSWHYRPIVAHSFMLYICSNMPLLCVNVDLHVFFFNFVDMHVCRNYVMKCRVIICRVINCPSDHVSVINCRVIKCRVIKCPYTPCAAPPRRTGLHSADCQNAEPLGRHSTPTFSTSRLMEWWDTWTPTGRFRVRPRLSSTNGSPIRRSSPLYNKSHRTIVNLIAQLLFSYSKCQLLSLYNMTIVAS